MSRTNAQIRFNSGIIVYGLYNATVGSMFPRLFTSQNLAWDALYPDEKGGSNYRNMDRRCICGNPPEDVEIAVYLGKYWPGLACIHCWCIVDGLDPYQKLRRDIEKEEQQATGTPGYWSEPLDDHTLPEDGLPDWWITR